MLEFFGDILTTIYDFFPNYAFAIIIFTCLVMIVLTPVTLKQTRSMLAMQKVAPELKKLRKNALVKLCESNEIFLDGEETKGTLIELLLSLNNNE